MTMKQKWQSCGSCRSCIPGCFSSPRTSTSLPFNVLQNEDNGRARSPMPEIKDKCRHLISKLGGGCCGGGGGWAGRPGRRRHSADFSYDPLSYALNFEDDSRDSRTDELLIRGFSAPPNAKSNASGAGTAHHLDEILEEESCGCWNRRPWPKKKGTSHNLLARIEGRGGPRRHSSSTNFSYDPSSYALNFQDENADVLSGFSARFQPPPPCAKCSPLRPEVVAFC